MHLYSRGSLSISDFGVTPPVGLAGELMIKSRVLGVISANVSSAEKAKPGAAIRAA